MNDIHKQIKFKLTITQILEKKIFSSYYEVKLVECFNQINQIKLYIYYANFKYIIHLAIKIKHSIITINMKLMMII